MNWRLVSMICTQSQRHQAYAVGAWEFVQPLPYWKYSLLTLPMCKCRKTVLVEFQFRILYHDDSSLVISKHQNGLLYKHISQNRTHVWGNSLHQPYRSDKNLIFVCLAQSEPLGFKGLGFEWMSATNDIYFRLEHNIPHHNKNIDSSSMCACHIFH